jgi:hypothetical protein
MTYWLAAALAAVSIAASLVALAELRRTRKDVRRLDKMVRQKLDAADRVEVPENGRPRERPPIPSGREYPRSGTW